MIQTHEKGDFSVTVESFFRTVSGWTASYSEGKYYLSIKNESSVTVYIKMCHMTRKKKYLFTLSTQMMTAQS